MRIYPHIWFCNRSDETRDTECTTNNHYFFYVVYHSRIHPYCICQIRQYAFRNNRDFTWVILGYLYNELGSGFLLGRNLWLWLFLQSISEAIGIFNMFRNSCKRSKYQGSCSALKNRNVFAGKLYYSQGIFCPLA